MEKAIRILDDATKSLKSEIRIWAKQGDMDIVEKCRTELRQCEDAIKILSEGEKQPDTASKCNKHIVSNNEVAVFDCPFCGSEWNTDKHNSCKCGAYLGKH